MRQRAGVMEEPFVAFNRKKPEKTGKNSVQPAVRSNRENRVGPGFCLNLFFLDFSLTRIMVLLLASPSQLLLDFSSACFSATMEGATGRRCGGGKRILVLRSALKFEGIERILGIFGLPC